MGAPSYDEQTLAAYFQPVHPQTFAHPRIGPLLERLRVDQPDLIEAVADVDRSQIRDALELTPEQRLRACFDAAAAWSEMRIVAR